MLLAATRIAGNLRQGRIVAAARMPPGRACPLALVALLTAAVAGCDRPSNVHARTGNVPPKHQSVDVPGTGDSFPPIQQDSNSLPYRAGSDRDRTSESRLPLYELRMDPKDLRALERDPGSAETRPAVFIGGGEVFTNVQVRFRGDWARTWPKKPLKIFFNRDKPFEGHHSLNLNSAWRDPAFVREPLAYQVYAACGVPASRSQVVRLQFNGQFHGLYVEVEQVDKTLLNRLHLKGSSLFKATSHVNQADERDHGSAAVFERHYEDETQRTNGLSDLQAFCHELACATNTLDFFNRRVELERYINYLAANVLVQNWDCFDKNHFVAHDLRGSQKWLSLPWDLDRTFGDHWDQSFGSADLPILLGTQLVPRRASWNRLQDRFFSEPSLRARFFDRLAELLEKEFTPEKLFPILDRLESEIGREVAMDRRKWSGPREDLHSGIAGVKRYIEQRRAYLQRELKQVQGDGSFRTR